MSADTATDTTSDGAPARRGAPKALITVLGVVVLLVGGAMALDGWVRTQIADFAASKVQQVLQLDSDTPVTVDIAGFSVLAQVLSGKLEQVSAGVDDVTIGELSGGVRLEADGIPLDLSEPVDEVRIAFTVDEASLRTVASTITLGTVDSVELADDEIRVSSGFSVFGVELRVGVGLEPVAGAGRIGFTPTSVELNGTRTSAAELSQRYGRFVDPLLETRDICIARFLPAALRIDEVAIVDHTLVLVVAADRAILDDASARELGSCPNE